MMKKEKVRRKVQVTHTLDLIPHGAHLISSSSCIVVLCSVKKERRDRYGKERSHRRERKKGEGSGEKEEGKGEDEEKKHSKKVKRDASL